MGNYCVLFVLRDQSFYRNYVYVENNCLYLGSRLYFPVDPSTVFGKIEDNGNLHIPSWGQLFEDYILCEAADKPRFVPNYLLCDADDTYHLVMRYGRLVYGHLFDVVHFQPWFIFTNKGDIAEGLTHSKDRTTKNCSLLPLK